MNTKKSKNILKTYALAGLIALATGLNSYSQKVYQYNVPNYISIAKLNSSKVSIKPGAGSEYYISRIEAEKTLDELCRNKNTLTEDAWMFHNNILTDIGYCEEPLEVKLTEIRLNIAIYNAKPGDTIILYHIHPRSYAENRFTSPSIMDMTTHAPIKVKCDNKQIFLIERMLDGRGVWDLDIAEDMIEKINIYETAKLSGDPEISSIVDRNEDPLKAVDTLREEAIVLSKYLINHYDPAFVNQYITDMSKLGIKLKFTPSEIIGKQ